MNLSLDPSTLAALGVFTWLVYLLLQAKDSHRHEQSEAAKEKARADTEADNARRLKAENDRLDSALTMALEANGELLGEVPVDAQSRVASRSLRLAGELYARVRVVPESGAGDGGDTRAVYVGPAIAPPGPEPDRGDADGRADRPGSR